MNVTSKGGYALRVMLDLAQHPDEGYIAQDHRGQAARVDEVSGDNSKQSEKGRACGQHARQGGAAISSTGPRRSTAWAISCAALRTTSAPVSCIKSGSVCCERAAECMTVPMWMELDDIINAYLGHRES